MTTQQDIIDDRIPRYYYFYCSVCSRWAAGKVTYYSPYSETAIKHLEARWNCYCGEPVQRVMEQLRIEFPQ